MRVGVIGAGSMGGVHAKAWAELADAELCGIFSTHPSRARALVREIGGGGAASESGGAGTGQHDGGRDDASESGGAATADGAGAGRGGAGAAGIRVYESAEALLKEVDVVDICTPTPTHASLVMQAAERGVHVLCEKPIARTLDEGRRMIDACRTHSVRLMIAHVLRFAPEYRQLRRMVRSGEHGAPAVLRFYRHGFSPAVEYDNWFLDYARSGGAMLDLMLHDIDIAMWVAGPVARVYATRVRRDPDSCRDEHGLAILEHANGAITHLEGSWAFPSPQFRWGFEVALEKRLLAYDSERQAPLRLYRRQDSSENDAIPAAPHDPYAAEIRAFHAALQHGTPFPITAEEGWRALEVALATIESAESGEAREISIAESGGGGQGAAGSGERERGGQRAAGRRARLT